MKKVLTLMLGLGLLWWAPLRAEAQDAKPADTPAAGATQAEQPTPAQLRVRLHRAMAALIEAQAAETPDEAKIAKLTKRVESLRAKIWAQGPVGPRAGYGPGPAGPGPRGPGWGRGYGPGGGYGRGGPGWGRGYGRGYGRGWGRGCGYGWGFVDRNADGICDYYQGLPVEK